MVSRASRALTLSMPIEARPCAWPPSTLPSADEDGKASAEQQRDGEAEAVANDVRTPDRQRTDHRSQDRARRRLCRPGDIALLAPTGNDLWRYEEALERRGIPVATQAGKGLFRRQEIQDLIALTRVLADRRDTLALGALLGGRSSA